MNLAHMLSKLNLMLSCHLLYNCRFDVNRFTIFFEKKKKQAYVFEKKKEKCIEEQKLVISDFVDFFLTF